MSEYIPLYISVILIIIIGVIVPVTIITFVDEGYTIDQPNAVQQSIESLSDQIKGTFPNLAIYLDSFKYIPAIISVPMFIIINLGFIYTIYQGVISLA